MHFSLHRSAALSLALGAMLLRAILPDGWMPSAQSSGSLFTICSVQPVSQTGKVPHGEDHRHVPCAFAAASTLAPSAFVSLAFGISAPGWRIETAFARERIDSVRLHRPNFARAPPAFA